jgi:hypothetical protein
MKVISIKNEAQDKRKQDMLEVLDYIRNAVEKGEIKEFVAASMDSEGSAQIHVSALDLPGSIGLFEIGKHLLIAQESGA